MSTPYPEYDEQGKIICQICGKSFSIISPTHLRNKHKITIQEYQKRFPSLQLTSGAYRTAQKLSKTPIFKKQEDGHMEEQPDVLRQLLKEVIVSEKPPADVEVEYKEEKPKKPNIVMDNKNRIFEELKEHLDNVEKDYKIQSHRHGGSSAYEFITDFCDPIARVIIDCPNTFWHNRDYYIDPQKFSKLLQDGWTIMVLESNNPTKEHINKLFEK